jgi:carboxyl-terminal processing protease
MQNKSLTNILFGIALALLLFGGGYKLGKLRAEPIAPGTIQASQLNKSSQLKYFDSGLFDEAVKTLNEKYVDRTKLDSKKEFYGSIKGMVASVGDPYTFFLTPEENKEAKDDLGGRFEGIGAQLGLKNNRIVVVAPLKNSPAEQAGIMAGDYIIKVDGKPTKDWALTQAVSKIRGPKGTKLSLTLLRDTKEFTVTLTRDQIHVDSVELSYQDNAAIIKVNQFAETTNSEWDTAVDEVASKWNSQAISGLVIDLRDNPGGFLDSAVYLSSEFLKEGKLVVKQESTVNGNHDYFVTRSGKLLDIPITVLINKGSASASEIFSGAIRDHKRGTLVGEKSFGKGSVQEALDLKGGAGLHVTVAKWILPAGEWINGKGIEPSVKVENKPVTPDTQNTPDPKKLRDSDDQLKKAIELATK